MEKPGSFSLRSLEDGEFWLPPKFLADDEQFMESKAGFAGCMVDPSGVSFAFEFSNGVGGLSDVSSNLSSPVESGVGSSETECEEDDSIAGLMRQMACSALDNSVVFDSLTAKFALGSPQSPLESSCGCNQRSGEGSPNGYAPVSLPPTTLDLFFAAAEVARRRINEEAYVMNRSKGLLVPPNKPSPAPVRLKDSNPSVEYYCHQLQAARFRHLRKLQMMKQQSSVPWQNQRKTTGQYQRRLYQSPSSMNNGLKSENGGRNCNSPGFSQSPWPALQETQNQHHGSGVRAVFLENLSAKKECAGTGVFLPRQIGNHSVTRKKSVCSSVLVPAKVIQDLNLNLNDMQVRHQSQPRSSPRLDPAMKFHGSSIQKRNLHVQPMVNQELRLPNEWTY